VGEDGRGAGAVADDIAGSFGGLAGRREALRFRQAEQRQRAMGLDFDEPLTSPRTKRISSPRKFVCYPKRRFRQYRSNPKGEERPALVVPPVIIERRSSARLPIR
jgi:hypothetical protein